MYEVCPSFHLCSAILCTVPNVGGNYNAIHFKGRTIIPQTSTNGVLDAKSSAYRTYGRIHQLETAAVQLPIGLEDSHSGVVDVVCGKAFQFSGVKGENVEEIAVPESMKV